MVTLACNECGMGVMFDPCHTCDGEGCSDCSGTGAHDIDECDVLCAPCDRAERMQTTAAWTD